MFVASIAAGKAYCDLEGELDIVRPPTGCHLCREHARYSRPARHRRLMGRGWPEPRAAWGAGVPSSAGEARLAPFWPNLGAPHLVFDTGHDSVVGETKVKGGALNYDELVVYAEAAALPQYLIVYSLP